jgi:hypothetical protein
MDTVRMLIHPELVLVGAHLNECLIIRNLSGKFPEQYSTFLR